MRSKSSTQARTRIMSRYILETGMIKPPDPRQKSGGKLLETANGISGSGSKRKEPEKESSGSKSGSQGLSSKVTSMRVRFVFFFCVHICLRFVHLVSKENIVRAVHAAKTGSRKSVTGIVSCL